MKTELSKQTQGRWPSILSNLGIDSKYLKNRHGECPICKAGVNRFRFDNKEGKGTYYCNQCGAGDGVKLAMNYLGLSFKETAQEVRKIIGECQMTAISETKPDTAKNEARIKLIYAGLKRITADDPAGKYLMRRGINAPPPKGLAYHAGVDYWEQDEAGKWILKGAYPALVGVIRDDQENVTGLQINYLTADGNKADIQTTKKNIGKQKGNFIKLRDITNSTLCITEGIINALAVMQDTGFTCWSAINAGNFEHIQIPEGVEHIYIYADKDESATGNAVSTALQRRFKLNKKYQTVCLVFFFNGEWQFDYSNESMDYAEYLLSKNASQ